MAIDFIKEWKSVSDDTLAISSSVANEILKRSKSTAEKISSVNGTVFKDGSFDLDITGLDKLTVKYTIYYCQDRREYNELLRKGNLSCESDYFDAYIRVVIVYIDGQIEGDFIGDINHEINHILEVSKGFRKTRRGMNLYTIATSIASDKSKSAPERSPAFLIYVTFNHEEDSFAVQYYSQLKNTYKNPRELDQYGMFEKTLEQFVPYQSAVAMIKMYNENCNEPEVIGTIKAMNLTVKSFENRVDKGMRRLKRKLYHAYERLVIELENNGMMPEQVMKVDRLVEERFGRGKHYQYDFEDCYVK